MAQSTSMRVWDKGQITIPNSFRKALNIEEGTIVYLQQFGDSLLIRPKESVMLSVQKRAEEIMSAKGLIVEDLIKDETD